MNVTRLFRRVVLSVLALAAAALLASFAAIGNTTVSAARASTVHQAASENWAGYDVSGQRFSSVSGTWTQPQASANSSSSQSYSAFWVGLGGTASGSDSLEQVGTASDYVDGHAQYYAWYELVPAGQVRLNLNIHPGDKVSGKVTVNGTNVTVSLTDQTTGGSVVRTLQMSNPDTSSAEWIAEAPASETQAGGDEILPLTDFGKVTFTDATASAGGHTGGISDSNWSATRIDLQSGASSLAPGGRFPGFASGAASISQSTSGATTSTLTGNSFSVRWQPGANTASGPGGGQFPGGDSPVGPVGPAGNGYGPFPYF